MKKEIAGKIFSGNAQNKSPLPASYSSYSQYEISGPMIQLIGTIRYVIELKYNDGKSFIISTLSFY